MASRSNTIRHSVRHFEKVIGRPIPTTPAPTPVFVAVFGTRPGSAQTEVLGGGHLATDRLVLGDADTVAALADGAVPTMVGIAWVASAPRAQARTVKTFGPSAFASPASRRAGRSNWPNAPRPRSSPSICRRAPSRPAAGA